MASLFQSFRSSSMPKRLLRYALSRLELLDAEALDIDNLDFALGRNTVFEFRDVGIKLKKLEKLLQLPATFKIQKAGVLLLRVTIPMDFYTSPIMVDVQGVDVKLSLADGEETSRPTSSHQEVVPNPVDLAQSFLETERSSERQRLEQALVAETQDPGSSPSASDDSSEDEPAVGTGHTLSLPEFLAGFLQGIVDRMQINISDVKFEQNMKVRTDATSSALEPISLQLFVKAIEAQGVTTMDSVNSGIDATEASTMFSSQGKRLIRLSNVRAFLASEASLMCANSRQFPNASSSFHFSTAMPRSPPAMQESTLSHGSFSHQPMASLQTSFRQHLSDDDRFDSALDRETSLDAPHASEQLLFDELDDYSTRSTPRASLHADFTSWREQDLFHSMADVASHREEDSAQVHMGPQAFSSQLFGSNEDRSHSSAMAVQSPTATGMQDLAESHLYTHEEAESMYMSALSTRKSLEKSQTTSSWQDEKEISGSVSMPKPKLPLPVSHSHTTQTVMPGAWQEEFGGSSQSGNPTPGDGSRRLKSDGGSSSSSSPAFSGAASMLPGNPDAAKDGQDGPGEDCVEQDGKDTPKGPARVMKQILELENVSIYVPTHESPPPAQATGEEPSTARSQQFSDFSFHLGGPGAFSYQDASGFSSSPNRSSPPPYTASPADMDHALEVLLSPLSLHLDASVGLILAKVIERLIEALKQESSSPASAGDRHSSVRGQPESRKTPGVKLVAREISINFLNRLNGKAENLDRHCLPCSSLAFDQGDLLLNASLQSLAIAVSEREILQQGVARRTKQKAKSIKVDIGKFRIGYADGDIISFDSSRRMASSVRDNFISSGHDVAINMLLSSEHKDMTLETLPVIVQLDLHRLDETLGWFGGLSGFVSMSMSATSSGIPSPNVKPTPPSPSRKARGVHFESPASAPASSRSKINVRIGGSLIELIGRDGSSIAAESKAIKVVVRDEQVGAACSCIRISGPYIKNSAADASIMAEISGTRLELSGAPKDRDLEKLLELIIPSKVKFDDGNDGDDGEIMVDTLLRQRRKGSVLMVHVENINVGVSNIAQLSPALPNLADELTRLSSVATRYLPEDDRPGLLTLATVRTLGLAVNVGGKLGKFDSQVRDLEVAHVTVPSLVAVAVGGVSVRRNDTEDVVSCSTMDEPLQGECRPSKGASRPSDGAPPVIMARMIGDEMEPTLRLKLANLRVEYRVPTVMDALGLSSDATPQDFEECLAASVVNLSGRAHETLVGQGGWPTCGGSEDEETGKKKPLTLDLGLRHCLVGLNPLNMSSKMIVVLTDARLKTLTAPVKGKTTASMSINKASILLADRVESDTSLPSRDSSSESAAPRRHGSVSTSPAVAALCAKGFVDICYISSASIAATVKPIVGVSSNNEKQVEVLIRDDLLVLETCPDSTQTLIATMNALKPPTPPSKEEKYRTSIMPVQDLLASISAEAFGRPEGDYDFDQDFGGAQELLATSASESNYDDGRRDASLRSHSSWYSEDEAVEELFDAGGVLPVLSPEGTFMQDIAEGVLLTGPPKTDTSEADTTEQDSSDELVIHENYYARDEADSLHCAKVWNSSKNSYDKAPDSLVRASPLKLSIRDVHVIWNLFDGYDWTRTREVITKAVEDIESKAIERQQQRMGSAAQAYDDELEDEEAIGDFLFNSIYIGVDMNRDPHELTRAINQGLNDDATETETVTTATTNRTARQGRHGRSRSRSKRLRLNRSKRHKVTFELRGVNADMVLFPPPESASGQETLSSIDVRIGNLEIFDHVPTSTWKKFATYDQDRGEREMGTSMVHVELLTVRPIPQLAASEIVLRAEVLPLRLHVDQDALDFVTRFFEFKDDGGAASRGESARDVPFIQRAEILDIPVKLDFKPKRVDYAGLRSGHTTEFMNFIVLEEARMVMRHAIVYGTLGFDRLGKTLNDIWMPDVRRNQLPGVVAGLAPVRSFVNIGSGFRDLVEIPLRDYRKDGRVVRSISKGAFAFARTTGTELVKLGAKIAVGTQYALAGAEEMLTDRRVREAADANWEDFDDGAEGDMEERKQISLYADQPTGVMQGIRGGYRSLTRDVNLARDAIIAVPGEAMASGTASGAARAVLKRAPTIIFRPAIGVTKAIGQTLLGATNTIDPENKRRIYEKYKH